MEIKCLPSHEEMLDFATTDRVFWKKVTQLSTLTLQHRVEVAFKIESSIDESGFYISRLKTGDTQSVQPGKSTSPYDVKRTVHVLGIHSHIEQERKPRTAILSIDDLFSYISKIAHNVDKIHQATGITPQKLYDESIGNVRHHEGIVRATKETIGVLLYQPPMAIIRPGAMGYNLAVPNNHYVNMIKKMGPERLNNQRIVVEQLRECGYQASFLQFERKKGSIAERI